MWNIQSVMIWGAGVGHLCFLESKVTPTVYQNVLEDFMIPSAAGVYRDADLIFQQELAPAHTARRPKTWFKVHSSQSEENEGHPAPKQSRQHQANPGFHNSSAMPRCIKAVIKTKGFPTKYLTLSYHLESNRF